jgi:hypothetical protein
MNVKAQYEIKKSSLTRAESCNRMLLRVMCLFFVGTIPECQAPSELYSGDIATAAITHHTRRADSAVITQHRRAH